MSEENEIKAGENSYESKAKRHNEKRKKVMAVVALIVIVMMVGWTILGTLLSVTYADSISSGYASGDSDAAASSYASTASDDMRGIWVSTVYRLDYPESATTSASELKSQADEILDNCKAMGMNAVFLQVRPSADALYDSQYYPWSRYLTGTAGTAPQDGLDPLEYWVSAAHERGLELHAWINPYRITCSGDTEYDALPEDSPAKSHSDWVVKYNGNYYFDPAIPEVRRLVVNGALEIVQNYDVDGIHLDDYFYPGTDFDDASSYEKYGSGFSDIGDFRRDCVNQLISELDEQLHAADPSISFGVSPSGIWANNTTLAEGSATSGKESYSQSYADSLYWAEQGIVDYLAPQIYWSIGYSAADYSILAKWWNNALEGTGARLYIGMADYRSAQADDSDSVWYGTAELERQLNINRENSGINGEIHFRYKLMQEDDEIPQFLAKYYSQADENDSGNANDSGDSNDSGDDDAGNDNTPDSGNTAGVFTDVTDDAWYAEAVGYVYNGDIMNGTSDSRFSPGMNLTRGMLVTILYRLAGEPDTSWSRSSVFSDVSSDKYYSDAVAWASEKHLVNGYGDGTFRPDVVITREQAAALFFRYASYCGHDVTTAGSGVDISETSSAFRDGTDVSEYAVEAVKWAIGTGLINGTDDNRLDPQGSTTRAQTAAILMRFCENILADE